MSLSVHLISSMLLFQGLASRLAVAEQRANKAVATLSTFCDDFEAAEARVLELEARLAAAEGRADIAEGALAVTTAKLSAAEDREAGLEEELERARMVAQSAQYKAGKDVDAARSWVAAAESHIDEVNGRLAQVPA